MKVLYWMLTGTTDPTRASVPLHIAANGSLEAGDTPMVALAGDATGYLVDDELDRAQGVGVPALPDLFAKLRAHEVPVHV